MKTPTQSMLNYLCNYKAILHSSDNELCKNLIFGYIYLQLTNTLKLEPPIQVYYQKANKTRNIVKENTYNQNCHPLNS